MPRSELNVLVITGYGRSPPIRSTATSAQAPATSNPQLAGRPPVPVDTDNHDVTVRDRVIESGKHLVCVPSRGSQYTHAAAEATRAAPVSMKLRG